MKTCPKCGELVGDNVRKCFNCNYDFDGSDSINKGFQTKELILTTTDNIEGYEITKYIKVINADVVMGTGFASEFGASFADFLGAKAKGFSDKLASAKNEAYKILLDNARLVSANAVVGIKYSLSTTINNMLLVSFVGTAVVILKK